MLIAENIHKSYGKVEVLKGVDIKLSEGEIVALVGTSGAGKSTLLQVLGTLDSPDQGNIWFEGQMIHQLPEKMQAKFRNESLGFVFQFHHLLPEFTALENVCIPGWIGKSSKNEIENRAKDLLDRLGLSHRLDHKPSQLSGGEQQRVSVARALINQPRLILADEPTGNLDTQNSQELYDLLFSLTRETGVAFLVATHNMALAEKADRVMRIQDGMI
ncbi:MAG: ABC transporter ATP-binding protein [Bacteroidia bacterium]|nr:ABC transporter ATP-binding protein [Bacteroidia bacterium]